MLLLSAHMLGYQGPGADYRKVEKIEVDPGFRAVLENPLFERIAQLVIVDSEGTSNFKTAYAAMDSDFVVIPTRSSRGTPRSCTARSPRTGSTTSTPTGRATRPSWPPEPAASGPNGAAS